MKFTTNVFVEERLDEVLDFVKRASAVSEVVCGWEAGRFVDWRWGGNSITAKDHPTWFSDNCEMFANDEDIRALAISEYGGKDVSVLIEKRDKQLLKNVLEWLLTHWAPKRGGLSFDISQNEYWMSLLLESAGFKEELNTGHEWEYDLTSASTESYLPEGYVLESLAEGGKEALHGIAEVSQKAFKSKDSLETLVDIKILQSESPLFVPELSIYTRSPEGKIASYCRGTVNPENGIAAIDPVCCHPDFTRRGLAKAAVQECFRRQAALGGRLCYIGSAPTPAPSTFLYRSLNPVRYFTNSCWKLDAEERVI